MDGLHEFLLDTGLVSRDALLRATELASEQGESLDKMLVRGGFVSADDVRRALAAVHGVPLVRLEPHLLSFEDLILIPEPMSRAHMAIAYASGPRGVEVAVLDLDDVPVLERQLAPRTLAVRLTDQTSMKRALLHYQKLLKEQYGAVFAAELGVLQTAQAAGDADHSAAVVDAAARVLDTLLRHALVHQAHEVVLQPHDAVHVRYRMHDAWYDAMTLPLQALPPLVARARTLASMSANEVFSHGRFSVHEEGTMDKRVSVGVHITPMSHASGSVHSLAFTLAHDTVRRGSSLSSLSCRLRITDELRHALQHQHGLILVCGPMGAGKTSMLYTLLDECSSPHKSLATVETAVQTHLPAVSHMEVREEYGVSSASCFRAQLRQGANVVMIDCPLDAELVEVALHAANRGTLVLLGIHASSAAEGIEELMRMGVSTDLLASVFTASVGVARIPALCQASKISYTLSRDEQHFLEEGVLVKDVLADLKTDRVTDSSAAWKDISLWAPASCDGCDRGFTGTIGIQEVISATATLSHLIRQGADASAFARDAHQSGAQTLAEDALYKAVQGRVAATDVLTVARG